MNSFKTTETTLLSKFFLEKALWIDDNQGLSYRVFESTSAMLNFFNSEPEAKTYCETELELDSYLEHLSL